jgi:hypothetical protein
LGGKFIFWIEEQHKKYGACKTSRRIREPRNNVICRPSRSYRPR